MTSTCLDIVDCV